VEGKKLLAFPNHLFKKYHCLALVHLLFNSGKASETERH
jgi:hypothetical protein